MNIANSENSAADLLQAPARGSSGRAAKVGGATGSVGGQAAAPGTGFNQLLSMWGASEVGDASARCTGDPAVAEDGIGTLVVADSEAPDATVDDGKAAPAAPSDSTSSGLTGQFWNHWLMVDAPIARKGADGAAAAPASTTVAAPGSAPLAAVGATAPAAATGPGNPAPVQAAMAARGAEDHVLAQTSLPALPAAERAPTLPAGPAALPVSAQPSQPVPAPVPPSVQGAAAADLAAALRNTAGAEANGGAGAGAAGNAAAARPAAALSAANRAARVEVLSVDRMVVDAGKDALAAVQMFLDERKLGQAAPVELQRRDAADADALAARLGVAASGAGAAGAAKDLGLDATVPVAAVAPTEVADQVASWVTQQVREAELRVDGAAGERVDVRISLDGNEARVEFGCDTEQLREVLQSAAQELGNLLRQENLVLADVQVGAGWQRGMGQNPDGQPRQPAAEGGNNATTGSSNTARGSASEGVLASSAARVVRTPLGALDLFV